MKVKIEKIEKSFPELKIDFSLEVESGSFTSIVGPSGCGKTTLLKLISGLLETEKGKIFFGEKEVTKIPPEKRNTGLVFQNDTLFSHLNVFDNIGFGLKMRKKSKKEIEKKVLNALELVHLQGFENREVNNLSGGEKRRTAIARAISFEPDLLLLDEPLNGLDAKLKEKMKLFLKELSEKTSLTVLMVTHDIDEAFFLSDKIVVMNNGRVEQEGKPEEIFLNPINAFVKNFVSDYVLIEGKPRIVNGKKMIEGKFLLPAKGKGKALINFKKTNYKFLD
ncbi:MAG: ABC transporter ATP-binding protein [Candidatus Diapherotrites archaeon CG10_big_fil_rev_8_21_14_0_10_31_34]|nr:MAG: ABC transporter ATP-binding protein [Candidatus Diapherotrites archaeon CG10_big_fil_rev_8_21_14_0_10_31_34]